MAGLNFLNGYTTMPIPTKIFAQSIDFTIVRKIRSDLLDITILFHILQNRVYRRSDWKY